MRLTAAQRAAVEEWALQRAIIGTATDCAKRLGVSRYAVTYQARKAGRRLKRLREIVTVVTER